MNREALGVRIRSAVSLSVPVAVALLLFAAPAHATFPGKNGKIAFTQFGHTSPYPVCIYSMNPDGTGKALAAPCPQDNRAWDQAAWAADGHRLAYVDGFLENVWYATDGQNPTEITEGLDVGWSPDGQKIVVSNLTAYTGWELWTQTLSGAQHTTLRTDESEAEEWSPDGTKIGFSDGAHIDTINPDGSGLTQLTTGKFGSWSPDGSKIAFTRNDDIWSMNADGSGQVQLTTDPSSDQNPTWSPDGSKIAFQSLRDDPNAATCVPFSLNTPCYFDIFVMNASGTNQTNVTNTPTTDEGDPAWQPLPINGYPRPKGATPFLTNLTVAYKPCTSPNEQHGSPLAVLSCSPPQQASDFLTVGTLDSNGQKANAIGSVRYDVKPGTAANPGDDADVKMNISIKDVRLKDLSDYAGELQVTSARRITDKLNTPAPDGTTQAATTQDTPFSVTVPCAPTTADTTIGSLCAIATTADAVVPGQVTENARSNWELGQFKVYDGGSDQDADTTADNTLFMDEGIFVP